MAASGDLIARELLDLPYQFHHRSQLIPGPLATKRRVPLLLMLVDKSHGAGASWRGLQVLSWAVRDDVHSQLLAALQRGHDLPDRPIVRFEPALDRAIDLAVGLGYLEKKSSRVFRLSDAGRRVVSSINASDALLDEKQRLSSFHGKISNAEVDRFIEWRTE